MSTAWLDEIRFNADGLVPATAQGAYSVRLWHKGEESGHTRKVVDIRFDCDEDVILLKVGRSVASRAIPVAKAAFIASCRAIDGSRSNRC